MRYFTKIRVIVLTLVVLGGTVGFLMPRDDGFFAIQKNFTIFSKIYEELSVGYVDQVDAQQFMYTGIKSMLATLDPYTVFYDEALHEDSEILQRGQLGDPGFSVSVMGGQAIVTDVREGASADEAGISVGDRLVTVAGRPAENLSESDLAILLQGEPGSQVLLNVFPENAPSAKVYTLTRSAYERKTVSFSGFVNDDTTAGIGYVKLEEFDRGCAREVRKALEALNEITPLQNIVLDLRGNPGGLLNEAVEIVSFFVPEGSLVVTMKGRSPESTRAFRSQLPAIYPKTPLIVLVNENSASASEIVAGAIQDLDRGVVLGQQSFGKGLVQIVKPLPYHTSLKLTIAKYYTPSGRCIQKINYTQGGSESHESILPDSLRNTFYTAAGRPVRDGGGVEPDVPLAPVYLGQLEQSLINEAAFFRYAGIILQENGDRVVSDKHLGGFKKWTEEEGFSWQSNSEQLLDQLEASLTEASYDDAVGKVNDVRRRIEKEKEEDFTRYKEQFRRRIQFALNMRIMSTSEQVRAALEKDNFIDEALALFADTNQFNSLLRP